MNRTTALYHALTVAHSKRKVIKITYTLHMLHITYIVILPMY